jgi:hypothetical protein
VAIVHCALRGYEFSFEGGKGMIFLYARDKKMPDCKNTLLNP